MSESPETRKPEPSEWMPNPDEVRGRLLAKVDDLPNLIPGLGLILPTLRAKLRGLSDAEVCGMLVYLDDLVAELWGDDSA